MYKKLIASILIKIITFATGEEPVISLDMLLWLSQRAAYKHINLQDMVAIALASYKQEQQRYLCAPQQWTPEEKTLMAHYRGELKRSMS